MKIVVDVEDHNLDAAWKIVKRERLVSERYDRVGWGHPFGTNPTFYVRRLVDGLSIIQADPNKRRPGNRIAP